MSFYTRCVFCGHRIKAPARALGASGKCPRCAEFFTLTPEEEEAPAGPSAPWAVRLKASSATGSVCADSESPPVLDKRTAARGELIAPEEPLLPPLPWIEPLGLAALLANGAALLCASFPTFCPWVLPLALLALLLGTSGWLLVRLRGKHRLLVPVSGTLLAAFVAVAALAFPSLLGPDFEGSKQQPPRVDPLAMRAMPLPGGGSANVGEAEWTDASRAGVQQGNLHVQVVRAKIAAAGPDAPKAAPVEKFLILRVRFRHLDTESQPARIKGQPTAVSREKPRPRLTDHHGKVYAQRDLPPAPATDKKEHRSIFPVSLEDDVFAFEPPSSAVEYLRLELTVQTGTFRFTIPASMIEREKGANNEQGS